MVIGFYNPDALEKKRSSLNVSVSCRTHVIGTVQVGYYTARKVGRLRNGKQTKGRFVSSGQA